MKPGLEVQGYKDSLIMLCLFSMVALKRTNYLVGLGDRLHASDNRPSFLWALPGLLPKFKVTRISLESPRGSWIKDGLCKLISPTNSTYLILGTFQGSWDCPVACLPLRLATR